MAPALPNRRRNRRAQPSDIGSPTPPSTPTTTSASTTGATRDPAAPEMESATLPRPFQFNGAREPTSTPVGRTSSSPPPQHPAFSPGATTAHAPNVLFSELTQQEQEDFLFNVQPTPIANVKSTAMPTFLAEIQTQVSTHISRSYKGDRRRNSPLVSFAELRATDEKTREIAAMKLLDTLSCVTEAVIAVAQQQATWSVGNVQWVYQQYLSQFCLGDWSIFKSTVQQAPSVYHLASAAFQKLGFVETQSTQWMAFAACMHRVQLNRDGELLYAATVHTYLRRALWFRAMINLRWGGDDMLQKALPELFIFGCQIPGLFYYALNPPHGQSLDTVARSWGTAWAAVQRFLHLPVYVRYDWAAKEARNVDQLVTQMYAQTWLQFPQTDLSTINGPAALSLNSRIFCHLWRGTEGHTAYHSALQVQAQARIQSPKVLDPIFEPHTDYELSNAGRDQRANRNSNNTNFYASGWEQVDLGNWNDTMADNSDSDDYDDPRFEYRDQPVGNFAGGGEAQPRRNPGRAARGKAPFSRPRPPREERPPPAPADNAAPPRGGGPLGWGAPAPALPASPNRAAAPDNPPPPHRPSSTGVPSPFLSRPPT
jgi:hypothetical protein